MVNISIETISHVLNNDIPHETIIYDDQHPHELIKKSQKSDPRKISFLAELSQMLIMGLF